MTLPATGGTWADILQDSLNPLAERYWPITDVLIRDYFNADGTVFNLADPSVGLGAEGVFTPFAADGTLRSDLLITAPATNLGFYHLGELKEDAMSITPDQTIQQTPTAQSIRSTRNVLTKLDDKIQFTAMESTPLVDALRYELPLSGGLPEYGTPGYQLKRPISDVLQARIIVLLGFDNNDGQRKAEVFPLCYTDKKGKTEMQRKNADSLELTYEPLGDPYTKSVMWICRDGQQWRAQYTGPSFAAAPVAAAVTGSKATLTFAVPSGGTAPLTYTVAQQVGGTGAFTASTLSGSPNVSNGNVTLTVSGLTSGTAYVFQVTVTDANSKAATSASSNSVTATS
ncbi:Ig-like domain repeat protein [Mycobacterium eburneum]|nr:Ig-like domain-containing protein [Mycobacterium eburneum]TDH57549.1 Ig-like domain repeat protein [Mycobacterium eburneum]